MSTQTDNLKLNKPGIGDFYDIAVHNENMDIIDEEITELKKSVSDGKTLVANTITGQGVATVSDATFAIMATNINTVATNKYNEGVSATKKGTASASQVLSGYTFTNASSVGASGTMTNNGAVNQTLNAGGSYTIPVGYHNGSGKVTAKSLASQTSGTANANDIASGKSAYVNGVKINGVVAVDPNIISTTNHIECDDSVVVGALSSDNLLRIYTRPSYSKDNPIYLNADRWYTVEQSRIASAVGLTADKLVSGNTVLGVSGTAITGRRYASGAGTILTEQISGANSLKYRDYVNSNVSDESYLVALYINLGISFTPSMAAVRYYNSSKAKYFKSCMYAGQNVVTSISEDLSYTSVYWYGNSTSSAADSRVFLSGTKLLLPIPYSDFNYGKISNLTWEAWE